MSKHKKQKQQQPAPKIPGISKRGWKVIAAGIALLVVGFTVLSFADPSGENLPSHVSPFLLVAGYVTIGIGIILPDKSQQKPSAETEKK